MNEDNAHYYRQNDFDTVGNDTTQANKPADIVWQDLEFPIREKTSFWYLKLISLALIITGLLYLFTKDIVTVVVIILCLIVLLLFGLKKPKSVNFLVSNRSFKIGNHEYQLNLFRSYTIRVINANHNAISFLPIKRFSPEVTLYVKHEKTPEILQMLSNILPMEESKLSIIDYIMEWFGI